MKRDRNEVSMGKVIVSYPPQAGRAASAKVMKLARFVVVARPPRLSGQGVMYARIHDMDSRPIFRVAHAKHLRNMPPHTLRPARHFTTRSPPFGPRRARRK